MSVIISGDNGISDVDGSAGTPAIRGTDANTGIFFGSDIIGFSEGGTECARFNADAQFVAAAGTASLPVITTTGDVNTGIFFPAADTIAFAEGGAEAMRITSDGRLGIGTTAPAAPLEVLANSSNALSLRVRANASNFGVLRFASNDGNTIYSQFDSRSDGFLVTNVANIPMVFATNDTERARITSGGALLVGTTNAGSTKVTFNNGNNVSGDQNLVTFLGANCNNTVSYHYISVTGGSDKLYILGNGNVQNVNNSYGALSDIKTKQDVVDAGSQWEDIKKLRIRKFRFKSDPTGPLQIGVVAQEAELVSPGLIDESTEFEQVEVTDEEGNVTTERQATGETIKAVKYSVLYMKAVKALQEAMERIETLEAKVAALEANT